MMSLDRLSELPRPSPVFLVPLGLMVGSGLALYQGLQDVPAPWLVVVFVVSGWVTSLCLHEFGHALAAYLGGDTAVKEAGYLSLNPLKYTHPVNSIVLPILILFLGGIGLPGGAVYVHYGALRNRWWQSLTAAAGPLGTIAFHVTIAWPFLDGQLAGATRQQLPFWAALAFLALLEISALVFNLLPVPGLDGFGIIAPWLPGPVLAQAYRFGDMAIWVLILVLWTVPPATQALWGVIDAAAAASHVPVDLAHLGRQFFRALW